MRPARADERRRWDGPMAEHHYPGFRQLAGRSPWHVAQWRGRGPRVALVGWQCGAFGCGPRGRWLGWHRSVQLRRPGRVVASIAGAPAPWRFPAATVLDRGESDRKPRRKRAWTPTEGRWRLASQTPDRSIRHAAHCQATPRSQRAKHPARSGRARPGRLLRRPGRERIACPPRDDSLDRSRRLPAKRWHGRFQPAAPGCLGAANRTAGCLAVPPRGHPLR